MRYTITARLYGELFLWMLKTYYKKHFPGTDFSQIRKNLKAEYRAMVERTPGIGGGSLETDLIGACFFRDGEGDSGYDAGAYGRRHYSKHSF